MGDEQNKRVSHGIVITSVKTSAMKVRIEQMLTFGAKNDKKRQDQE